MDIVYSEEQEAIFSKIAELSQIKGPHNLLINSVAGSSKTFTMVEAIKRLVRKYPAITTRLIVFGKANSIEATRDHEDRAMVSTVHSMALQGVKQKYDLSKTIKSYLTWKDVPKDIKIPFGKTNIILNHLDKFCTSEHLSLQLYFTNLEEIPDAYIKPLIAELLNQMATGKMPMTHNFYLKLYHIAVVDGLIKPLSTDVLILEEVQDLNPIMLDIVDKIESNLKIFIGDDKQAIMNFAGAVNAFAKYKGHQLSLTKSYRVSSEIAQRVEKFMRKCNGNYFEFKGTEYPEDFKVKTEAILTRTNAALIGQMLELNKTNIPYNLSTATKVQQLFMLPLALIVAEPGAKQQNPDLSHIQDEVDKWYTEIMHGKLVEVGKYSYLRSVNEGNKAIELAIDLISKYGETAILDAHRTAKSHIGSKAPLTLSTITTSKGMTYDKVTLDESANKAVREALLKIIDTDPNKPRDKVIQEELNLYYVACTRARVELHNATYM